MTAGSANNLNRVVEVVVELVLKLIIIGGVKTKLIMMSDFGSILIKTAK